MLITNSLPQLWLYYIVLSLIVLGAGYFAIGFLPRVLRWTIVGLVAGAIAMPWTFSLLAAQDSPAYTGTAPAIIIAALDVLAHRSSMAIVVVAVAAIVGAVVGFLLAVWSLKNKQGGKGGNQQGGNTRKPKGEDKRVREPTL